MSRLLLLNLADTGSRWGIELRELAGHSFFSEATKRWQYYRALLGLSLIKGARILTARVRSCTWMDECIGIFKEEVFCFATLCTQNEFL